jgi:ribosomal-protein-serine acetyltransferase
MLPELARLGFVQEGTLRQIEWLYDHFVDHVVYAMDRRNWPRPEPPASTG